MSVGHVAPLIVEDSSRDLVAGQFFSVLAPRSLVTFQTFDDTAAKRGRLARIFQGLNAGNLTALHKLNDNGAGAFFMVNQGDGKGRASGNVTGVRALFVDLDGAPLEPVLAAPLRPQIAVQSSPGRFHAYWLVDGVRLDEFTDLQKRLAERFDADPSVSDLPRVMRVPGFWHHKSNPFESSLIHAHSEPRFSREQFLREFQFTSRVVVPILRKPVEQIPKGRRNPELLSRARGFVNKGLQQDAINQRMQAFNAEYCSPPLCAAEVDAIVTKACAHPSKELIQLPAYAFDAPDVRQMPDAAYRLYIYAQRQAQAGKTDIVSLPWGDFVDVFPDHKKFYRARKTLLDLDKLKIDKPGRNLKHGKTSPLFRVVKSKSP